MDYTARLPVETICQVLICAQDADPVPSIKAMEEWAKDNRVDAQNSRNHLTRRLAWVNTTHVCARWRAVAFATSSLWSEMPIVLGPHWVKEFVARGQSGPITVHWESVRRITASGDKGPFRMLPEENFLLSCHERVRNLVVVLGVDSLPRGSWPMLEDLTYTLTMRVVNRRYRPPVMDVSMFDGDLPRLRSLTWDRIPSSIFPWGAQCIRHLTRLSMLFDDNSIVTDNLNQFLNMLEGMMHLQDLRLRARTSTWPEAGAIVSNTPAGRTVSIPLKVLALAATLPILTELMKHIIPPPTVRVLVRVIARNVTSLSSNAMQGVLSLCRKARGWLEMSLSSSPFITAEVIELRHEAETQIRFSRSPAFPASIATILETKGWDHAIEDTHLDVAISLYLHNIAAYGDIVTALVHEMAPQGIRALSMDFYEPRAFSSFIPHMMHHAVYRDVQCLRLFSDNAPVYLGDMIHSLNTTYLVPLPATKILAIHPSGLASIANLEPHESRDGTGGLGDFLIARREANAPIHTVYIGAVEDVQDACARLVGVGEDVVAESQMDELVNAFNVLKGRSEVTFISKDVRALYAQDMWKAVMG
ncbi:unnamed protein product [Peniophora sp. CBMAI 1063]|nr:unnamed protein product [Peniophora sp. CBMAI 1063]